MMSPRARVELLRLQDTLLGLVSWARVFFISLLTRPLGIALMTALTLLTLLSASFLLLLTFPPNAQERRAEFQALVRYRTNIAVMDAHGTLIGSIPQHTTPPPGTTYTTQDRAGVLLSMSVPTPYRQMLQSREDRYLHFRPGSLWRVLTLQERHYQGIDLHAMFRAALTPGTSGASTLCMQMVKNMRGPAYYKAKYPHRWSRVFARKYDEILDCASLWEDLRAQDGALFWRLVAASMPHVQAGPVARGLRDGATLLFGKSVTRLTPGEQAILSASTWRQIQVQEAPIQAHISPEERWATVVKLARRAARRTYTTSDPRQLEAILSELDTRLSAPPEHIMLPRRVRGLVTAKERKHMATLSARLDHALGSSRPMLRAAIGHETLSRLEDDEHIEEVTLSLDWAQNHIFKRRINARLSALSLHHRLTPTQDDSLPQANVHIRVSNQHGQIVRHYRRGDVHAKEPVASVAKILGLLPIVAQTQATPETTFCNRYASGLRNASGPLRRGTRTCSTRRAGSHATLEEMVARSLNLPTYEAMRRANLTAPEWLTLYDTMGLTYDDAREPENIPSSELAAGLAFGHALGSFHDVHLMASQLFALLDSKGEAPCLESTIATRLRVVSWTTGDTRRVEMKPRTKCARGEQMVAWLARQPSARQTLRHVLRAPVTHPKGTLRFALPLEEKYGVEILYAKTGTSVTASGRTRGKWLVASVREKVSGERYDITTLVSARDTKLGLGKNVSSRAVLRPILEEIFSSFTQGD